MDIRYPPDHQQHHKEVQLTVVQYFALGGGIEPKESDFEVWLIGLPYLQRVIYSVAGFEAAKHNACFRRYCLELEGFSFYEYMSTHLSPCARAYWQAQPDIWGAALNRTNEQPST